MKGGGGYVKHYTSRLLIYTATADCFYDAPTNTYLGSM